MCISAPTVAVVGVPWLPGHPALFLCARAVTGARGQEGTAGVLSQYHRPHRVDVQLGKRHDMETTNC